jgi:hypothetical protein
MTSNEMIIDVWIDGKKFVCKTTEMCPHCLHEVELDSIPYKRQACPHCKRIILACSACNNEGCTTCQTALGKKEKK